MVVFEWRICSRGGRLDTLSPPRSIAVGKLRYSCDAFLRAFRPLFHGHGSKQAQIFLADSNGSTPRLEVTNRTVLIQDNRRRLSVITFRGDCLNNLTRFREV